MAKNGNRDGTIFYDERLKKWRGQIVLGTNHLGKPIRKSVSGKNKTEVKKKLREVIAANPDLNLEYTDMTINEWLDFWLETYKRPQLTEQSYLVSERIIRIHLKPNLPDVRLQDLTTLDIQIAFNKAFGDRTKYSQATARTVKSHLNRALKKAVELNLLSRNPTLGADLPKVRPPRQVQAMTRDEQKKCVDYWLTDPYSNIFIYLLATGKRISETLGLTWEHVDLKKKQCRIEQIMVEIRGNPKFQSYPKTDSGRRVIYYSKQALECVLSQREKLDEELNHLDLVFPSTTYNFRTTANLRRYFKRTLERAGVDPGYNLHSLRHTYATRMIENNCNIKFLQASLGHKNVETTLQIYADALQEWQRSKADEINIFR